MKLTCEIVQDLLPLYEDGVCSPDSRDAVEEHLNICPRCRGEQETARQLPETEIDIPLPDENRSIRSFKKVRRRWGASLLAVLLLIPILVISFNQIRGVGVCYTNIDEILLAKKFVRYLQSGEYDQAAQMYDFRPSYESILEALEMSAEAHGPIYVECKIGDEIWYMNKGLLGEIDLGYDETEVWMQLVWNHHYGILVPPAQMEALAAMEPGIVSNDQDGYTVNGQNFYPFNTPWGVFLVEDSSIDSFIQSDRELLDYGSRFTLIPEDMYQDLEEGLLEESQRIWTSTQEMYAPVADMTEDEFCAHMQEKYAAELEEAFSGVTLKGSTYTISYRIDTSGYTTPGDISGGWSTGIQTIVIQDGSSAPLTIYVHIENGKATDISASYSNDSTPGRELIEALFPSFVY